MKSSITTTTTTTPKNVNPLTRNQKQINVDDSIAFVLPQYMVECDNAAYHRSGRVLEIVWSMPGIVVKNRRSGPLGFDVQLDIPMSSDLIAPNPVFKYKNANLKGKDTTHVFVRFEDVTQDHLVDNDSPLLSPLPYGVGTKICVSLKHYNRTCIATIVGLVHRNRNTQQRFSRSYRVSSGDPTWPRNMKARYEGPYRTPVYAIPLFMVGESCVLGKKDAHASCNLRTKLAQTWAPLRFYPIHNVVTKPTSTHKDGNTTPNCIGVASFAVTVQSLPNSRVNIHPKVKPLDGGGDEDDEVKKNIWRFYHGFTEPPTDDDENGIYFDTRGYGELDFYGGSLRLRRCYLKQGYMLPKVGDVVCGIPSQNQAGPYLRLWFVCSDALRKLILYVRDLENKPTLDQTALNEYLLNDKMYQSMNTQLQDLEGDRDVEKTFQLQTYFNTLAMPRTESTSWPPFRTLYAQLLYVIMFNYSTNQTHTNIIVQMPNLVNRMFKEILWCKQ